MHQAAAFLVLLASALTSSALSIKHVQDLYIRIDPTQALRIEDQQSLASALTEARRLCIPVPDDLVIAVEEIVAQAGLRTGVSRTEVVSAYFRAKGVSERQIFQGELLLTEARQRGKSLQSRSAAEVGAIAVQLACTPKE